MYYNKQEIDRTEVLLRLYKEGHITKEEFRVLNEKQIEYIENSINPNCPFEIICTDSSGLTSYFTGPISLSVKPQ